MKCSIPLRKIGLDLTICADYSCEMALNVDLDVSLDSVYVWKGMREKRDVNSTKAYIIKDETYVEILTDVTLVYHTRKFISDNYKLTSIQVRTLALK
jgi:hypothetical protein